MAARMSGQKRFEVVLEPDEGRGWHAYVPKVRGCRTWGRSLGAARRYIREALAACIDVLGEDAERIARDAVLEENVKLPGEAKKAVDEYLKTSRRVSELQDLAQMLAGEAAAKLTKHAHLSLRDAGDLLGLSHERVNQVMNRAEGGTRARNEKSMARAASKKAASRRSKSRAA
jgi:predicted RNase H-like HicB family nuclease